MTHCASQSLLHSLCVYICAALFGAAAVMISFGAVLGRTSPSQLIVMLIIEIALYSLNYHIGVHLLKVFDVGGSMIIHSK